jgi:methionyl-tRNA synthetase
LNLCLQTAYAMAIMMNPVLPFSSEKIWHMLNLPGKASEGNWENTGKLNLKDGHEVGNIEILFEKIPDEVIAKEVEYLRRIQQKPDELEPEKEVTKLISIDEFKKIDLKSAKVISAELVEGTQKLMKMQVEVGNETRQLVAGIAEHYQPADLINKTIIIVANLQPARIRGVESQGMLLAVADGKELALLTTDKPVLSGKSIS